MRRARSRSGSFSVRTERFNSISLDDGSLYGTGLEEKLTTAKLRDVDGGLLAPRENDAMLSNPTSLPPTSAVSAFSKTTNYTGTSGLAPSLPSGVDDYMKVPASPNAVHAAQLLTASSRRPSVALQPFEAFDEENHAITSPKNAINNHDYSNASVSDYVTSVSQSTKTSDPAESSEEASRSLSADPANAPNVSLSSAGSSHPAPPSDPAPLPRRMRRESSAELLLGAIGEIHAEAARSRAQSFASGAPVVAETRTTPLSDSLALSSPSFTAQSPPDTKDFQMPLSDVLAQSLLEQLPDSVKEKVLANRFSSDTNSPNGSPSSSPHSHTEGMDLSEQVDSDHATETGEGGHPAMHLLKAKAFNVQGGALRRRMSARNIFEAAAAAHAAAVQRAGSVSASASDPESSPPSDPGAPPLHSAFGYRGRKRSNSGFAFSGLFASPAAGKSHSPLFLPKARPGTDYSPALGPLPAPGGSGLFGYANRSALAAGLDDFPAANTSPTSHSGEVTPVASFPLHTALKKDPAAGAEDPASGTEPSPLSLDPSAQTAGGAQTHDEAASPTAGMAGKSVVGKRFRGISVSSVGMDGLNYLFQGGFDPSGAQEQDGQMQTPPLWDRRHKSDTKSAPYASPDALGAAADPRFRADSFLMLPGSAMNGSLYKQSNESDSAVTSSRHSYWPRGSIDGSDLSGPSSSLLQHTTAPDTSGRVRSGTISFDYDATLQSGSNGALPKGAGSVGKSNSNLSPSMGIFGHGFSPALGSANKDGGYLPDQGALPRDRFLSTTDADALKFGGGNYGSPPWPNRFMDGRPFSPDLLLSESQNGIGAADPNGLFPNDYSTGAGGSDGYTDTKNGEAETGASGPGGPGTDSGKNFKRPNLSLQVPKQWGGFDDPSAPGSGDVTPSLFAAALLGQMNQDYSARNGTLGLSSESAASAREGSGAGIHDPSGLVRTRRGKGLEKLGPGSDGAFEPHMPHGGLSIAPLDPNQPMRSSRQAKVAATAWLRHAEDGLGTGYDLDSDGTARDPRGLGVDTTEGPMHPDDGLDDLDEEMDALDDGEYVPSGSGGEKHSERGAARAPRPLLKYNVTASEPAHGYLPLSYYTPGTYMYAQANASSNGGGERLAASLRNMTDPSVVPVVSDTVRLSGIELPVVPRQKYWVGAYTLETRQRRLARFMEKRRYRVWEKTVKYDVRKSFADSRLRVKGRFVKKDDEELLRNFIQLV